MRRAIEQRDHIAVVAVGARIGLGEIRSRLEQAAHLEKEPARIRLRAGRLPVDVLAEVAGLLVEDGVGCVDELNILSVPCGPAGIGRDVLASVAAADADAVEAGPGRGALGCRTL